jgi:hypothetical protein
MKVFMSWSGQRSKATAELLGNWIKCVVQSTEPWISTSIERGAVWSSTINNELKEASFGIICLTHENKEKPWILFESGALAKGLAESRVCTFLIDLQPHDIGTPLSQFNATLPDRDGLWSLVLTLNAGVQNILSLKVLEQMFEIHYPLFEVAFKKLLEDYPMESKPKDRTEQSILSEILDSVRGLDHRMRAIESKPKSNYVRLSDLSNLQQFDKGSEENWDPNNTARIAAQEASLRISAGAALMDIFDELQLRFGKVRAKVVMELAMTFLKNRNSKAHGDSGKDES